MAERALHAEMAVHLGYDKHAVGGRNSSNSRNGLSAKTRVTEDGPIPLAIPRDRNASFEPRFIGKHQRKLRGVSDEIIELYAHGLSQRDIQSYLEKRYGTEVSPAFISRVTDQVMDEVRAWQLRVLVTI